MGLFKKIKELKVPSMPSAQPQGGVKQVDFDNIMGEGPPASITGQPISAPMPPTGMGSPPAQPVRPPAQGVPPDVMSHQPLHMHPEVHIEEGFELPDFDEKDIRELDKIKSPKPVPEVKPRPVPKDIEPPKPPREIEYPKTEPLKVFPKEKFVDIADYLGAKTSFDDIKALTTQAQETIVMHKGTIEEIDVKYSSIAQDLNELQEKLMIIDNELFEGI